MALLNNDRLTHWVIGALVSWMAFLLCLFIPLFHWLLGFSIVKIAVSASIGCAGQLAATPWLFSARATAGNPVGDIPKRVTAVIIWFSLTALLFFYYSSRDWPNDEHATEFKWIMFGTTLVFGVMGLTAVALISRNRRRS